MLATARRQYEAQGVGVHVRDPMATEPLFLPSSNANSVIDGDGIPRRVPQLAVRNRVADNESSNEGEAAAAIDGGSDNGSSGPASSQSSQRPRTPMSLRSASDDAVTTRRSYGSESGSKSKTSVRTVKKKKGGMLGFLTLKEPSTSAWCEFAQTEKEKAKQKGGNIGTSGLAAVSKQKLPDFVPKVNSKWDGLPASATRKSAESKTTSRTNRTSDLSSSTRQSNWTALTSFSGGSREASHAAGFQSSPLQSPGLPRTSTQSNDLPILASCTSTSSGSTKRPPALAIDTPPRTAVVEETDENKPQTFLLPPSPTDNEKIVLPQPNAPITPPELEGMEIRQLQELDTNTHAEAQGPAFPLTPPAEKNNVAPALVGIHYPEMDANSPERTGVESRTSDYSPEPMRNLPSPTTSSPPSKRAINFSRPRREKPVPPPLRNLGTPNIAAAVRSGGSEDGVALSPGLHSDAGRYEAFIPDQLANPSKEMGRILQRMGSPLLLQSRQAEAGIAEESSNDGYFNMSPRDEEGPEAMSTFYDDQERPDTAGTASTAFNSPERSGVRSNSIGSLAPSYASSGMSEIWRKTPKERLGLGLKARRSEVVPWEVTEELEAMREASGPTSPIPEGMRKRLSLRLNSKR